MDRSEISKPITITLEGFNYISWSQAMSSFLKGRKLWRYITGDFTAPTKNPATTADEDFADRLEDWESKNHQVITWFRNTSSPSIALQFGRFDTAKEIWDFLRQRYTTADLAHQFQLLSSLHHMKQEPGQSIHSFLSQMHAVWDQLTTSEPVWTCPADATKFASYRDQQRLIMFLMSLTDRFEHVRASLLHRSPLPTLDQAVSELLSEETRLGIYKPPDTVAATTHPGSSSWRATSAQSRGNNSKQSRPIYCNLCKTPSHSYRRCPARVCPTCHKTGPGHYPLECPQVPSSQPNPTAAVANTSEVSSTFSLSDIEAIVKQVMSSSNPNSTAAMSATSGTSSWLFDSACCNHMSSDLSLFSSRNFAPNLPVITAANGTSMPVSHVGSITTPNLSLSHVYHLPSLTLNLISVGQLCDLGLTVLFSPTGCVVQDPQTGQTIGIGRKQGRLFELIHLRMPSSLSPTPVHSVASTSDSSSLHLWHSRLGHVSLGRLRLLISSGHLGSVKSEKFDCLSCQLGKQPALSFNTSTSVSLAPFDLIHSDVWGPSPNATMGGSKYFVIFVDDFSRYTWIYLLHNRSQLPQIYSDFAKMIQTQFSRPIKIFRSDNAMEYKESSFLQFLNTQGTIPHRSCPGTSQQNGRAERKHRHILDTVRTLLISSSCPERFWGEAALTAVYTINRVPSPLLGNISPYEKLYGHSPTYTDLRVFGCACFVLLQPHEHSKLEPRSRLCCFLGYGIEHKGYRCWDPLSKRLRISRHVIFWEHKMFSSMSSFQLPSPSTNFFTDTSVALFPNDNDGDDDFHELPVPDHPEPSAPAADPAPEPGHLDSTEHSLPPPRRSSRVSELPIRLRDYHCYSTLLSHHEPRSFREASTNPLWQEAMADELQALEQSRTWDLVDLPPGKTAIGSKWVYKIKTRPDGTIERHKARLVAQGFTQEYGIDYEETFAPVARLTSVRSLIAVAASRNWRLSQMDVKNAFLNGDLTEEVFMRPPPGYSNPHNQVCKLNRALYGLKQSPRAWFAKFSTTISQLGFVSSPYDSALFIRRTGHGAIFLLLYVDDMVITGDDLSGISDLKTFLHSQFEMKDLGSLSYFLGLEISSDASGYYLTQAKYASDLLARAGLSDSKTVSTPLETNVRLTPLEGTPLADATLYRQLVGSLVYLTVTRPDIAFAVHLVSQFMTAPRSTHYAAVLRILRFVKGTLFHGLHYSAHSSLELCAYSDADWAGDPTDRRSTTGFCFFLGSSLISWRSKKQTLVARSSTEAEYRALADTTQELLWLRWLLADLGVTLSSATTIHCDNRSAIQIAHNDVFHDRTKHIELDCHFIRQHITRGTVHLQAISSVDQPADIFTKPHSPGRFVDLVSKLKLANALPS